MAKAILVSARRALPSQARARLETIAQALTPDHIDAPPPLIHHNGPLISAVINPGSLLQRHQDSFFLGTLFGPHDDWHHPGHPLPDGSFALFRHTPHALEVATDPAGSRTIWTFLNEDLFIASTSQQAIIMFLGNFHFNPATIPWMLSSSGLGPGLSWDWRIKPLGPDASLYLDRTSWTPHARHNPIVFLPQHLPRTTHRQRLDEAIQSTFTHLNLDLSNWAIALSGGYDSRALLAFFHRNRTALSGLHALTWGTREALQHPSSDAALAHQVAQHYGLSHRYFLLDQFRHEPDVLIDRFLLASEGRVDHLTGYMDGFSLWKHLFDARHTGLLRGDEGFGLKVNAAASELQVRLSVRLGLCSDFQNLRHYQSFGLPEQTIPTHLCRLHNESLPTWRDRLFHLYKLPFIVAGLGDIKASYLDQVSPLLSRPILTAMRSLPDPLRNQKNLFCELVDTYGPPCPIATSSASLRTCETILHPKILTWIAHELRTPHAESILPQDLVRSTLSDFLSLHHHTHTPPLARHWLTLKQTLHRKTSQITPRPLKNLVLRSPHTHHMDISLIAWRLALISRMTRRLNEAALTGARRITFSPSPYAIQSHDNLNLDCS